MTDIEAAFETVRRALYYGRGHLPETERALTLIEQTLADATLAWTARLRDAERGLEEARKALREIASDVARSDEEADYVRSVARQALSAIGDPPLSPSS